MSAYRCPRFDFVLLHSWIDRLVQGGLPLNLLASAHGKIGQLLKRVLHLAGGTDVTQNTLEGWVESLQQHLPKTYRRPEIYTLLAEMAWTTLTLKIEAGLTSASEAIAILNRSIPGWRERYPLPMDDVHAHGLLEQLIREASSVRVVPKQVFLPVERYLEQDNEGWHLRSRLTVSDELPFALVASHFGLQKQELPRTAELGLTAGPMRQTLALRQMAGRESYRCARSSWGASGSTVALEHVLSLTAPDGRCWSAPATRGAELDSELPWIFVEQGSEYALVRQGSGNIAASEAVVLMPATWSWSSQEAPSEVLGETADPPGTILHTVGDLLAENSEGLGFKLRLGRADAQEDMLVLSGNRSWLAFANPAQAFLGKPELYRCTPDGRSLVKVDGEWTTPGTASSGFKYGPLQVRYPAKGDVRYRSRLLALPEGAQLIPEFRDSRTGALRFRNWHLTDAQVTAPLISQHCEREGNDLVLVVQAPPGRPLPEQLQLELRWPHTTYPVRLAVAFPAQGVRAFDAQGEELPNGNLLAQQQLLGVRLRVALGQENLRCVLELEAGNNNKHRNVRKHVLNASPGALFLEVRLVDFTEDIQQLFSTDEYTDARVLVTCKVSGAPPYLLNLARYAGQLSLEESKVALDQPALAKLSPQELTDIPMMALRLEALGEEALRLQPLHSEGVPTGCWDFSPAQNEPGSWLVYPGADSKLPFRPTLFPISGDKDLRSELAQAFAFPAPAVRLDAIDAVLTAMSADFNHVDWQQVDQLIAQVGHLPLPTLDLWKRFAHSPQAMAALALRFSKLPEGFLERFANELTFTWELIPLATWKRGIHKLQAQCINNFRDSAKLIFELHLNSRIDDLCALNGALAYALGIASTTFIEKFRKDFVAIKHFGTQLFWQLFEGDACDYMKLRQSHADDKWPEDLFEYARGFEHRPPFPDFLYDNLNQEHYSVVNIPILLALQIATDTSADWFLNPETTHHLRKYRAFDRHWFVTAFNHTLARTTAENLLIQSDQGT